jgi:hypothetical protein
MARKQNVMQECLHGLHDHKAEVKTVHTMKYLAVRQA